MASRFYLSPTVAADVSPSFNGGWEQTGQATRRKMYLKTTLSVVETLTSSSAITVPITTTQDILCYQFVSDPLPAQRLIGTCSFVMRCIESATTANVTLAGVLAVVSGDGSTVRGTLFSTFNTGTEFATGTAATRFWVTQALTDLTIVQGDRLVLEIGAHAAGPTAGTTYTMRSGYSSATDLAYSTGVTTDNNPSLELSQTLFGTPFNNYQSVDCVSAAVISVTEKIR